MASQANMSTSTFAIVYDGEGLHDNSMNVRELAHSMLAVDDLFRRTNIVVNGENTSSALHIRPPRPGSYEAEFVLSIASLSTALLGSDYITSATNLLRLLFGSQTPGLFTLIKRLRGRTPNVVEASGGNVTIEADWIRLDNVGEAENLRMTIPTDVFRLSQDRDTRKAASNTIAPLRREGIDKMVVRERGEELEELLESDVESFTLDSQEGVLGFSENRQYLTVITTRFSRRSRRWQFNDGNKANWYTMRDEEFIGLVTGKEISFTYGDIFECEVRTTQRITPGGGIATDLEILRVIGRLHSNNGGFQLRF